MGAPASSYATAGLALRIIWPHEPPHYIKVGTPSGGGGQLEYTVFICLCSLDVHVNTLFQITCFYINSVHENFVNFELSYYILQMFANILYFLMYSPIMAINVAETCSCWYALQYIVAEGNSHLHNVVLTAILLFCWKDNVCVWKGRQEARRINTHILWQRDVSNNYHNLHMSCNVWSSFHCLKDGNRDNKEHGSSCTSVSSIFVFRKIYSNDS
jgi:hypothetical protein